MGLSRSAPRRGLTLTGCRGQKPKLAAQAAEAWRGGKFGAVAIASAGKQGLQRERGRLERGQRRCSTHGPRESGRRGGGERGRGGAHGDVVLRAVTRTGGAGDGGDGGDGEAGQR